MSIIKSIKPSLPKENTLEGLIEGLDSRGLLVLQILIGQQAMKVLTEEKIKEVKPKVLTPNASDTGKISLPTEE